jgi:DNA-binding winged helix-turn-helix (wHTH) protein/Tol biopolymer transport system component
MPQLHPYQRILIGQLTLDTRSRELSSATETLYLEPQTFELLSLFIAADQGQLSRDQLIEQLWAGRVVSESAINKAVSLLRKAFAQLDPECSYIETLPKVGYRLCQNLAPTPIDAPETAATATAEIRSATEAVVAAQASPVAAVPKPGIKTKLTLALLWTAPLLFFVLWFFITLSPEPEKLPTPYINEPVPLSHAQGIDYDLSLSQDGTKLLYLSAQEGKTQLLLQPNPGKQQLLSDDKDIATAALSPDGLQVVWVKQAAAGCSVEWFLLESPEQKKTVAPCNTDSVVKIAWQNDSKGFYLRDRADKTQPYALSRYRLDTAEKQQITNPLVAESPTGELAFAESADGKTLAVLRYLEKQQTQLLLLDGSSFALIKQSILPFPVSSVDWLGNNLVLSKEAELLQYNMATEQLEFLFYTGRTVQSLAVVDHQIYYADYELDADIWQYDLAAGKARIRIGSSKLDRMPRLNQHGDLAFLSQRSGKDQIWLQPAGQNEYQLADLPGSPAFVRLQWSPDGESLLFSKDGALWQLMVASGQSRVLVAADKQVEVANWTADGTKIIYSSKQSGDWQLWQLDLSNASSTQLTRQGGYSGYLQGTELYFSKFHQDGLFVVNTKTGDEQLLLADFDKTNWLNWRLAEDRIYYFQPGQGIRQYQLHTKTNSLLLATPERFVHHYDIQNQQLFYVKAGVPKGDIYKLEPVSDKTN